MGQEFLLGLIGTVEGERDPHNLYLIFTFMQKIIKHYNLLDVSEEIFDTLSCYFPVDFRSPFSPSGGGDNQTVSRDELAMKLCQCLVASSEFIDSTVQLALEKLGSDLTLAKTDSLTLLVSYE